VNPEKLQHIGAALPTNPGEQTTPRDCPDPAQTGDSVLRKYADQAESYFDELVQGVASSLINRREPRPGDLIGSYRVKSLIGQGGMGTVYLAERADGEIEQHVAIKLLRADAHRPGWRDRFLRERQLLASLQHPSIVRVIDAGHTADGRPFLVMEHVDGLPIDRYASGIGIRQRIALFLRVCDGVSHAHRRLIIHRDLKPSNILVDALGQPKLLDFGIAKLLNETGDATQLAEQLLTPNYASPEQLKGEAHSTATDVYSLAAVLYKLLTGLTPREKAPVTAKEEVVPPSTSDRNIPEDVDFVIGKALRPEPEHRYRSADEFAADLRAVLERRPVQARASDGWYRTRRCLRRYWVPTAAALLVLTSLSAGVWIANRERHTAERRFNDVRQLATKLFDIDAQVAQLPGSSKTRQLIVDTALQYLKRVTADFHADSGLALELGTAYMRVARVEGVNISTNLGQTRQAEQSAIIAESLIDSVLRSQPANRIALLRAGQIAHDRMILASNSDRTEDMLRFAGKSVERLNQFLAARPLNTSDHVDGQQAIIAFMNVASHYLDADRPDDAIRIAGRAIEIANVTGWPTQAGAALMVVALAHRQKGQLDEALQAIRESVRLLEPDPDEAHVGRLLPYTLALVREGQILGEKDSLSLGRTREAAECIERALRIAGELARRDSTDFGAQYRMFFAETKLAAMVDRAQPARAAQLYDDALQRLAHMTANASTPRHEAETLADSVYPLLRLGRRAEARKRLDAAFELLSRMREYPSEKIELGSTADDAVRALAEYEAADGRTRHGAVLYEELLSRIAATNPNTETNLENALDLSTLYTAAARLERLAGRKEQASSLEQRRLTLWQRWDSRLPHNAFIQGQMGASKVARTVSSDHSAPNS
jgi:tetratricopeptide (TPR) repeat protein